MASLPTDQAEGCREFRVSGHVNGKGAAQALTLAGLEGKDVRKSGGPFLLCGGFGVDGLGFRV